MTEINLIQQKIHEIRGEMVMLDFDLAFLYEVDTKTLNQAVKRNIDRFPEEFRFQLNNYELEQLVTNCDRFNPLKHTSNLPYAFTEQGVAMLSGVLKSEKAIKINIAIMRTFVILRNSLLNLEEITSKVKEIENQFPEIYKILNYLMDKEELKIEQEDRPKIGYKK